MKIPQCSPKASYTAFKNEIDQKVSATLESGWYILGNEVSVFEKSFADFCSTSYCISCANGTDAIELALRAAGVAFGDLVVTVANTAVATVAAIERTGAIPIFSDISEDTFTMSPSSLNMILEKYPVKAIVPVHLFGHPAEIGKICELAAKYEIPVIEDCAQAHGAKLHDRIVGTFGMLGTFSFYPTKNLGALGDGGAVITDNPELKDKLTALRQYGWRERYISSIRGINSRLDELQASVLNVKLQHLEDSNSKRRAIADTYHRNLKEIKEITLPSELPGCYHVYHQYVIQTEYRDELRAFLQKNNIGTAVHYPAPVHQQPAYKKSRYFDLSITEKVNKKILSLPMFPEMKHEETIFTIEKIIEFFSA